MPEIEDVKLKKRRIDKKNDSKHLQCEFYLEKKKRRCAMQRKVGQKYCSEHMINDEKSKELRVPCPLDPKHSIWKKDLQNHLKKCNASPKTVEDPWFSKDLNINLINDNTPEAEILQEEQGSMKELYNKYIPILMANKFKSLEYKISSHNGLNNRLTELSNQKHAIQQSSLIGNLKDKGFLDIENFYLEFGCGKGELSRFVNLCMLEDLKMAEIPKSSKKYGYGLIDRGVNRMKMDNKIVSEALDSKLGLAPIIKRTRIDIKDLNIDKFIENVNPEKIVAISKHLCGAATDLTLKSLLNSTLLDQSSTKFGGLLIAMCCRHVCSYEQLLPQSRAYLNDRGFKTSESFDLLKRMVSWAVCGNAKTTEKQHVTELSFEEREEIGLTARRLIDESRVFALKQLLPEFNIEMFWYAEKGVTLENVCLCLMPPRN